MSDMHGPPLDVVMSLVALGNIRDTTPDPTSIHLRSRLSISLSLIFGPGWPLLRLLRGFGLLAFCPETS